MLFILNFPVYTIAYAGVCTNANSDRDGDGWGYENGQSCTTNPTNTQSGVCIDPDGDGWGWNGQSSCATNVVTNTSNSAGACIDTDGDGWGWNGIATCQTSANPPQTNTQVTPEVTPTEPVQNTSPPPPASPTVAVQSTPSTQGTTGACRSIVASSPALYSAITKGAGKICLQAGNYALANSLSLRSNQTLAALTPSAPPVLNVKSARAVTTTGQTNITLDNLILDGNGSGASEFAILVGKGSRNISINNVTIRNTVGIGIGITGSHSVTVRNGSIRNIGLDSRLRQAIWVTSGSTNITIDGIYVKGRENDKAGGDHAITCIDSVNGYTVKNVRSEFAGSSAIAVNNCSNMVFTNNQLSNGREFGIDIVNGSIGAVITGNTISGFDRSAMVFDDHSWKCRSCGSNPTEIVVRNNQMKNNNRASVSRCKGISVDQQMVINPGSNQQNNDWVKIDNSNSIDADSALFCDHIH